MNWNDLYAMHTQNCSSYRINNERLTSEQIQTLAIFTLYMSHATSYLIFNRSSNNEEAIVNSDDSLELIVNHENTNLMEPGHLHLIALEAINQCNNQCNRTENNTYDVSPVLDFFEAHIKKYNIGETIQISEFVNALSHKLILNLQHTSEQFTLS